MKKYFTFTLLLIVALALSYYLAIPFGGLFFSIINETGMVENDIKLFLAGLPVSFLFWMSLYFALFRSIYKYVGIVIVFIITIKFVFIVYPRGFYVPFVFGLLGTVLGLFARNLYSRGLQPKEK